MLTFVLAALRRRVRLDPAAPRVRVTLCFGLNHWSFG